MIKRISYILIIIISVVAISFIFQVRFSKRAIQARENEKNIERVKLGMNKLEVIAIMGTPKGIEADINHKNTTIYYYEPTFGSSDGIYIYLEDDTRVTYIKKNE